jgi:hypothetical protein
VLYASFAAARRIVGEFPTRDRAIRGLPGGAAFG